MEMEPGEGKKHEMGESAQEELREGAEPDDMPMGKTNRKRSAKGTKNTKAPMDGGMYGKKPMDGEDCGCGGRKGKGKCDGNCGKKMDRNDALTPQEYLAACDLGIQGRSRSYIRARLDATERLDVKCGNGAISQGEKCHVGTAGGSRSKRPSIRRGIATGAKYGAAINGIAGAAQGATLGLMSGGGLKGALQGAAISGAVNTASGAVLGGAIGGGVNAIRKSSYNARRRARGLQDSTWADGFDPMDNRTDLKCGKGSISEGEKCHVGPAQKVQTSKSATKEPKVSTGQRIARGVTSGLALYGGLLNAERAGRQLATGNIEGALSSGGAAIGSLSAASSYGQGKYLQGLGREAGGIVGGIGAAAAYGAGVGFKRAGGMQTATRAARRAYQGARMRAAGMRTMKRDSIYAEGFAPELEQLAI